MNHLIEDLLSRLRRIEQLSPSDNDLLLAAEIFSSVRRQGYISDEYPEINGLTFTTDQIVELRDVLLRILRKNSGDPNAAQLIWALGRLSDPVMRDDFIEQLKRGFVLLGMQKFFLDQALIALEELQPKCPSPIETEVAQQFADCVNETMAWLESSRSEETDRKGQA